MKILCTVVLYNQSLYNSLIYTTGVSDFLRNSNVGLFIYDNSLIPQHSRKEFENQQIVYISDTSNSGVSFAYNCAYEYAHLHNYDWLLLFDQDTTINDSSYFQVCMKAINANPDIALFVPTIRNQNNGDVISPVKLRFRIPISSKNIQKGTNPLKNIGIINSGILVNVEAFGKVGGYNNKVFLDYSDYQFIERFSSCYSTFYLLDAILFQNFSNSEQDVSKLLARYILFCKSISKFEKKSVLDHLNMAFIAAKRAASLFIRTRRFSFFRIYVRNYLINE